MDFKSADGNREKNGEDTVSLGSCPGCWEQVCRCGDGKGYRGYDDSELMRIFYAVMAEVVRRRDLQLPTNPHPKQ